MMKTKTSFARRAAAGTASALLLVVFASGCATTPPPKPASAPDKSKDRTIHVPPGRTDGDYKDGPMRHRRHRTTSGQFGEPAPITHPGG